MSLAIQVKSQNNGERKYIYGKELSKYKLDDTEYLLGSKIIMEDNSVWFISGFGDSEMIQDIKK